MNNRTQLVQSALAIGMVCALACSERTLDFESKRESPNRDTDNQSSYSSGSAGSALLSVQGGIHSRPTGVSDSQAGMSNSTLTCTAPRQLSASAVAAIGSLSCNYWAVQAESTPETCRYELPTPAEPTASNEPVRMTILLQFDDGRAALLGDNNDPSCRSGFRSVGTHTIELDIEPCAQLSADNAVLQVVFGCSPNDYANLCVPDRLLTESELETVQAAACNAWALEPEGPLPESPCILELPPQSADGLHVVDPDLTTPLLMQKDGSAILLSNNTEAAAECASGFHFVDDSHLQLNSSACNQLIAGSSLQITFGCTPDEVSGDVK